MAIDVTIVFLCEAFKIKSFADRISGVRTQSIITSAFSLYSFSVFILILYTLSPLTEEISLMPFFFFAFTTISSYFDINVTSFFAEFKKQANVAPVEPAPTIRYFIFL